VSATITVISVNDVVTVRDGLIQSSSNTFNVNTPGLDHFQWS
jgi:hypothetical protein